MTTGVDHVEIERQAYELEVARGRDGARRYAAQLAADYLADNDAGAHAFWHAIERSLTIR